MLDVRDVTTLFNLCQLKFRCLTHGISCEVYDIYNMYIYIYINIILASVVGGRVSVQL